MNDSDKQCRFENRIPGISDSNTDLKLFAKAILKAAGKERMCLEQAKHLILKKEKKAIHIGVPMVLAVVDEGGNLTALHRMDGALLASLSIAQAKAFTALALRSPTGEAAASVLPGQPLYGLQNTHPGQFCLFGGGIPLFSGTCCIGAIGVSGGTVEQDTAVAEAMTQAYQDEHM